MPQEASLALVRPRRFLRELSEKAMRRTLRSKVLAKEKAIREERRIAGKGLLGVERVLKQRPTDFPWTREERRKLNPRVACRDKWRRIEILMLLGGFLQQYRQALKAWVDGERDVVFLAFGLPPWSASPYWMRAFHGVRCQAAPAPT